MALVDLVVVVLCSFAAPVVLAALYRWQPVALVAIVFEALADRVVT